MPVSRNTLDTTRNVATRALQAKVITPEVFEALTDGNISAGDSAKAAFVMARKSIFGGADKKTAATALANAIEAQMSEQGGG